MGGELWSDKSCIGLGMDTWGQACGPIKLGCRALCYKANLNNCAPNFTYMNSSTFLNPFAQSNQPFINPQMFTQVRGGKLANSQFHLIDIRSVFTLNQCQNYCSTLKSTLTCVGFVYQVPSLNYSFSSKCFLLSLKSGWTTQKDTWPKPITSYVDLIGYGNNSLANDGKWAPFVVAIQHDIL